MKFLNAFSALLLFLILVCYAPVVSAQISAPKYSNEFLSIGVGARSLGMGGAQVAIVEDATAAYWNPSGLLNIRTRYDIGLMHSEYFAGIAKYDYAGFATRLDSNSVIAITGIRFGVDDIPDTRYLYDANGAINYNNIKFFSAADYGFIVSYARSSNMIPGLKLGANFKVIHRVVGNFAYSWGFGLDAGAQYQRKGWMFGLMARDVTSTFNAWSHNVDQIRDIYTITGNEIPTNSIELTLPRLILGSGRYFNLPKNFGLLATIDLDFTFDGKRNVALRTGLVSMDPKAGIEFNYKKIAFLRFGMNNIQRIKDFDQDYKTTLQPNFGIGVKINKFYIDYALTDIGNTSDALYSNIFSVRLALNK